MAERAENRVERSGACVAENDGAGAEREAGGHVAGTERRAGVTEIGLSVERCFWRSRSAHMLWEQVLFEMVICSLFVRSLNCHF